MYKDEKRIRPLNHSYCLVCGKPLPIPSWKLCEKMVCLIKRKKALRKVIHS